MSIYIKLLEIQKKIKGLGKDKKSFNYGYVTGNKLLEYVKPIMNEVGVILKQEVITVDTEHITYEVKSGEKAEILYKVWQKFTWVDCDTGEKDENMFFASGKNDWEKGLGSALTYAERYFILKYFHIATDEDDIDNPARIVEDLEDKAINSKPYIDEITKHGEKMVAWALGYINKNKSKKITLLQKATYKELEETIKLMNKNLEK